MTACPLEREISILRTRASARVPVSGMGVSCSSSVPASTSRLTRSPKRFGCRLASSRSRRFIDRSAPSCMKTR